MQNQELKSNMLLLLTAAIWGFAFVAQRVGAQFVGAFTFGGIRFALGSISLVPLLIYFKDKPNDEPVMKADPSLVIKSGMIAGSVLYAAAALQQIGLAYTTAGKAAFITGLYIVLVPLLGIFLKQRIKSSTWVGVVLAVVGLYFLSVNEDFSIARGDIFEIVGAFFWASHILVIDHYANRVDTFKFSFVQFVTCSVLSLVSAFIFEDVNIASISKAIVPLLYGGILSAGVAYTLQAIGQKHAKPSHAAIILSMETVFAALGGALLLHENLGARGYLGCILMFAGMMVTQLAGFIKKKEAVEKENTI